MVPCYQRAEDQRKGAIQAPKQVDFAEALPLTALGKIDKKALRECNDAGEFSIETCR